MPDWLSMTIGVVLGIGGGIALAYAGLAWYWSKGRP